MMEVTCGEEEKHNRTRGQAQEETRYQEGQEEKVMDAHPDPSARWTNRRRMAWIALLAGVIYPVVVLSAGDRGMGLTDMAFPFYMFVAGVVGAYVGFATIDDKWRQDSYGGGRRW